MPRNAQEIQNIDAGSNSHRTVAFANLSRENRNFVLAVCNFKTALTRYALTGRIRPVLPKFQF